MCSVCEQSPCASRCPNSSSWLEADKPVTECDECGEGIMYGEGRHNIHGVIYCQNCIGKFYEED